MCSVFRSFIDINMFNLSVDTHRFNTGTITDGSYQIYEAARHLLNMTPMMSDEQMKEQIVNYYFADKSKRSIDLLDEELFLFCRRE